MWSFCFFVGFSWGNLINIHAMYTQSISWFNVLSVPVPIDLTKVTRKIVTHDQFIFFFNGRFTDLTYRTEIISISSHVYSDYYSNNKFWWLPMSIQVYNINSSLFSNLIVSVLTMSTSPPRLRRKTSQTIKFFLFLFRKLYIKIKSLIRTSNLFISRTAFIITKSSVILFSRGMYKPK